MDDKVCKQVWLSCVDGSDDHDFDGLDGVTWKCRDCKNIFTMYGDKVVHITKDELSGEKK